MWPASSEGLLAGPTPLIGRERELTEACELLGAEEVRLLTLVGCAGVGKTRLAVALGNALKHQFAQGVAFVDLATTRDPEVVITTIAHAVAAADEPGHSPLQRLVNALHDSQLLLILDNFEHVLAAAPEIAYLLHACPRLKLLLTSRNALHLRCEHRFQVQPLGLPEETSSPSVEAIAQASAVVLFVARVRAVRPGFALTLANAATVAAICIGLDGLPLALELAAARTHVLSLAAILERLEQPLDLLTRGAQDLPRRHQNMRDAIAWSYDLLHPDEQAMFRRLGVFNASCSLAEATAVCDPTSELSLDALAGLDLLVRKNLVCVYTASGPGERAQGYRFGLLRTVRHFALEQLTECGELDEIRRRAVGDASVHPSVEPTSHPRVPLSARDRLGNPTRLTPSERAVAELVATGLSNQHLANALVITKRTAETHVGNILRKLSLDSRTQLAAWVVEHAAPSTRAA